jgi:CubicO group peptidase (beta-lactamase class C family)
MKKRFIGLCIWLSTSTVAWTNTEHLRGDVASAFPEMDEQIEALRLKYDLPGVAVAVVRNGRLAYTNCYGVQDVHDGTPVTNASLFRIASISKPVTLVALLCLMQEGRLSMDSAVFGAAGILKAYDATAAGSPGWDKITIRHLIEHKSGIQNIPDDPMFSPSYAGLDNREIIARIMAERPLASEPGERYYYSNVGYSILGRVIEQVTGEGYEAYVKRHILAPCGITRMKIGHNTLEERFPDEVVYDQPDEPGWTYQMDVSRMDSHGGWIASATDLARFIVRIDRITTVPDIIDSAWLAETYMKDTQWAHSGSLPGTASLLKRMNDTFSFVILTNRRSHADGFWTDLSTAVQTAIEARTSWPDTD